MGGEGYTDFKIRESMQDVFYGLLLSGLLLNVVVRRRRVGPGDFIV